MLVWLANFWRPTWGTWQKKSAHSFSKKKSLKMQVNYLIIKNCYKCCFLTVETSNSIYLKIFQPSQGKRKKLTAGTRKNITCTIYITANITFPINWVKITDRLILGWRVSVAETFFFMKPIFLLCTFANHLLPSLLKANSFIQKNVWNCNCLITKNCSILTANCDWYSWRNAACIL